MKGTNFLLPVLIKNPNVKRFFKNKFRSFSPAICLIIFSLFLCAPFRNSLACEQIQLQRKPATRAQRATITRDFNIIGSNREIVEFEVTAAGRIEAKAEWSGTAQTLALILNGPGQVQYYSRQEGGSPLSLTFEVTSRFLSLGKEWKLSVVNFNSRTSAQGRVQITYPGEAESAVPVEPAEEKKEVKPEMRWSAPQMRVSEPGEAHKPPPFEKSVDILKPTRDFQYNSRLVKVNKRAAIPFKRFEVVDPATGKPIRPDQMLKLPSGEVISAGSYYDELNKLESGFNSLGYSLDIRRDPTERVKLQETSLSKTSIARNSEKAKIIRDTHRFPMRAAPASLSMIQSDFRTRIKFDKDRLKRLKDYRLPGEALPSPDGQTASEFRHAIQTPAYEFGYREVFAIFFNGKAELSAGVNKAEVSSEAEAGAYVFDNKINILRLSGNTFAPSSGGTMTANLTIWVAGTPYRLVDERVSIPSVPLDQLTQIPSIDLTDEWARSLDESYGTSFWLGPIFLSVKFGVRAEAGIGYGLFLCPLYARAGLGPFVASDVYAQAGIDIIIAEAGVRCTLVLLDNSLRLEAGLGLDTDERGLYSLAEFSIYDDLVSLSGDVSVYACIYVPAFDLPPWKKKCWDWEIASWDGIRAKGYIVEPQKMKFYIYEGGPPEVEKEEKPPEEEFKPTGDIDPWEPADSLSTLTQAEGSIFAPAAVEFNGKMYAFWLKGMNIFYNGYELDYLQATGPRIAGRERTIPGNTLTRIPPSVCVYRNRLYVFHGGFIWPDQSIYYRYMDQEGNWWPRYGSVKVEGSSTADRPALVVYKECFYIFYKKPGEKEIYYHYTCGGVSNPAGDGSELLRWDPPGKIPGRTYTSQGPGACEFKGQLHVFHRGESDDNIYHRFRDENAIWRPQDKSSKLGELRTSKIPQPVVFNDRLYVFCCGREDSIYYRSCLAESELTPAQAATAAVNLYWRKVMKIPPYALTKETPVPCAFQDNLFIFYRYDQRDKKHIGYRWLEKQIF